MIYVIGSGPSGVAATAALLDSGQDVTMLDYGLELEEERQNTIRELKALPAKEWPPEKISFLKGQIQSSRHGVRHKKSYGSDFIFRDGSFVENHAGRVDAKPSLAKGGFSNTWGSAVLPFRDEDLNDWPIKRSDLEKHYRVVGAMIGLSGISDRLETLFPFYGKPAKPLPISSQAEKMLARMTGHEKQVEDEGVFFGRSRLAVRAEASVEGPGCVSCGLCLYGCPHELIYNSAFTLKKFKDNPHFQYRSGVYVERVIEQADGIEVVARDKHSRESLSFKGDRVYAGSGVLSSTRIVLASREAYETNVAMKDSQYFVLPYWLREGIPHVEQEALHTLCQLFLEVVDKKISPYTVNLQLYTYNEFYSNVLHNIPKYLRTTLLGRLVAFQGYLHSVHSPGFNARLVRTGDSSRLVLSAQPSSQSKSVIRALVKKMNTLKGELGGRALGPLVSIAVPGEGNHYGGSFPMSRAPSEFQTDLWGRPQGFKRFHVVDASIFPSIPATTITYTIMANAHRIATEGALS